MKERRKITTHAEENAVFTEIKNIKQETNKNTKNTRRKQKSRTKWQNKSAWWYSGEDASLLFRGLGFDSRCHRLIFVVVYPCP